MRIVALNLEIVRATPAVAEFLAHVELEGSAADCEITGRALGPRCAGVSTVEVAYPMTRVGMSDNTVSLRCAIPEPNLWLPETPFTYVVAIDLRCGGEVVESRSEAVAFRSK
jgi:hypothetical protein